MKRTAIHAGWLLFLVLVAGCAANKVAGLWRDQGIFADGDDREWRGEPQFEDNDRRLVIRVTNDASGISLCVSAGRQDVLRRFEEGGVTIWFDPQGGEKHVFGIHLPGGRTSALVPGRGPAAADRKPRSRQARPPEGAPPPMEPLKDLAVTYADTTGPLRMTIPEVRRTGIDIGIGRAGGGRLVYEFNIAFRAAPSLCDLKPGRVVGIGFLIGGLALDGPGKGLSGNPMGPPGFGDGFSGPGPGGGMAGAPGTGGFRKKDKPFEVWLRVRLAGPGAGQ